MIQLDPFAVIDDDEYQAAVGEVPAISAEDVGAQPRPRGLPAWIAGMLHMAWLDGLRDALVEE